MNESHSPCPRRLCHCTPPAVIFVIAVVVVVLQYQNNRSHPAQCEVIPQLLRETRPRGSVDQGCAQSHQGVRPRPNCIHLPGLPFLFPFTDNAANSTDAQRRLLRPPRRSWHIPSPLPCPCLCRSWIRSPSPSRKICMIHRFRRRRGRSPCLRRKDKYNEEGRGEGGGDWETKMETMRRRGG